VHSTDDGKNRDQNIMQFSTKILTYLVIYCGCCCCTYCNFIVTMNAVVTRHVASHNFLGREGKRKWGKGILFGGKEQIWEAAADVTVHILK